MQILDPNSILALIKQGNPKAAVEQLIQTKYAHDPLMNQLYQMGLNNNTKGIEQFARQMFAQQGRDFDSEYNAMMSQINQLK